MPQFATAGAGAGGGTSGAGGVSGSGNVGGVGDTKGYGGNLDAMMADADKLLQSDKMSDQLKGQQLMSKASNMFQALSKLYSQQSDMQKAAIQNIR